MALRLAIIVENGRRLAAPESVRETGVCASATDRRGRRTGGGKRGSRTGANGRWAAAAGTFVELAASALVEAGGGEKKAGAAQRQSGVKWMCCDALSETTAT